MDHLKSSAYSIWKLCCVGFHEKYGANAEQTDTVPRIRSPYSANGSWEEETDEHAM